MNIKMCLNICQFLKDKKPYKHLKWYYDLKGLKKYHNIYWNLNKGKEIDTFPDFHMQHFRKMLKSENEYLWLQTTY